MKRMIALVLALTLVVSFLVLPASAGESPEIRMSVVAFEENKADGNVTEITGSGSYKAGDLIALKFEFVNNATARWLYTFGTRIKFDSSAVAPYSFESDDEESIGPFVNELGGITVGNPDSSGIIVSAAMTTGKKVAANATRKIGYVLFRVVQNVESGSIEFNVDETFNNQLIDSTVSNKDTEASPNKEISFSGIKAEASVTGQLPTLGSIEVKLKEGTGVYGAPSTFQLTALSTKGKDITSLVDFTVKDASGNPATFTINDGTLSIGSNGVGTYTVTATPKAGACLGEEKTATFEITSKKITNPAAAVVRFVKGNYLMNLQNQTISMDVTTTTPGLKVGFTCYEGTDTSGNPLQNPYQLKAGTLYSIVIGLEADTNYELDATKLKVTVNGGTEKEVAIEESGFAGAYKAIVTAETESAETPTITNMAEISAVYGDKLSAHTTELSGTVTNAAGDTVTGTFTWVDDADTTTVGTFGSHEFTVNFTPDDLFNYAPTTAPVTVNVAKKQITFDKTDYAWRAMNDETTETQPGKGIVFTYDGKEHGIEPYCTNDSIKDFVQFEYDSVYNRHTSVNTIGATVKANVVAANENCEIVGDVKQLSGDWAILSKTINFDGEYTANVQACYSVTSHTVTLDKFGLPNEVTSDPNTRYTLRDNKVIVDNNVLDVNSVVYENGTLRFNLVSGLSDTAVNTKASIMFGLYVNNYKTNHAAVPGISNGTEANLFILKADITLIAKGIDAETMTVEVPNAEYGVGVTPKVTGKPDSVGALDFLYTNTETKQTYTQDTIMTAPAGEYTLTVTCEDNTKIYKATTTFTITQRSIADATVTFTDLTYNGSEQTTDITVKLGEKTLTKVVDYTVTGDLKGTNAGEYTVTVNGTGNYTGTKEATFTIDKADLSGATITLNSTANMDYDGTPKTTSIAVAFDDNSKMKPTEDVDYTVEFSDNINAGDNAKVTITAKPNGNYTGSKTQTFTINKAKVTVENIAAQDKTYDGTNTAKITGTLTGVLEKDAANVTLNAPAATFASKDVNVQTTGTWTAQPQPVTVTEGSKFTLFGSAANNYIIDPDFKIPTDLTATIKFKTLTMDPEDQTRTVDIRYDNLEPQTILLPVPDGLIEGEGLVNCKINLMSGNAARLTDAGLTRVAGENKLTFQLKDRIETEEKLTYHVVLDYGSNYNTTIGFHPTINISIRSAQSTLTYTGATSVDYDKTLTLSYAGGSGTGNVWYTVEDSMMAEVNGSILTPKAAGNIFITVHKDGDSDYLPATSQKVQVTIKKATPATPPEIKVDNTDTTLGELGNKMLVEIGVPGTIHWYGPDGKPITDPDNTKIEANKEYSWTFVPADSTNYNEIRGTTTPYVRDDLSWLPGVLGGGSSFSFHDVTRFDYYYDSVKWAADNGIASGTSRFTFSPDAVCTRAQTVTFLWRAAGSPLPRYRACPFTDVHSYDYYYEAVLWAVEQGITTGLTATTFGPDETVTRGQVATFLYRAASAAKPNTFNPFTDVKPTAYNYGAILWAYDNRITTGASDTTFSPDAFCTRAQIVTFLYRYYQGR